MSSTLRHAAVLVAASLVTACASIDPGGSPGPAATAPTYHVGDRWTYRIVDGFRQPAVWEETHEVVAAGPDGVTVRITAKGDVNGERTEQWASPGIVRSGAVFEMETRRFDPPLVRYRFPMAPGDRWQERLRDVGAPPGPFGPIQRVTTVGGYEKVTTPAGTFDALRLRVFQRLDDETFWRQPTECNYLVWYAPAVGAAVMERRDASYREKSSGFDSAFDFPSQRARVELVATNRR